MNQQKTPLKTPLSAFHASNGAKMVNYSGWEMPLNYGSILEEHHQVRTSGGLFDVSHMGRLKIDGSDAKALVEICSTRRIREMDFGHIKYSLICNSKGGIKDDVLIYKFDDSKYLIVCNASNRTKILLHLKTIADNLSCTVSDETESTSMIALQGPSILKLLGNLSSQCASLKRYKFIYENILGSNFLISRTGYTGEDGVEIIFPSNLTSDFLNLLNNHDTIKKSIKPIGLGARDSLRIEASMPLYGQELTESINPLSAGLQFAVQMDKGIDKSERTFIGQEALLEIENQPKEYTLTGLQTNGKKSPRNGMKVLTNNECIGYITSGLHSPTLKKSIAMAYLKPCDTDQLQIDFGSKIENVKVVAMPFYKKT